MNVHERSQTYTRDLVFVPVQYMYVNFLSDCMVHTYVNVSVGHVPLF